jgi:hypothetical protein
MPPTPLTPIVLTTALGLGPASSSTSSPRPSPRTKPAVVPRTDRGQEVEPPAALTSSADRSAPLADRGQTGRLMHLAFPRPRPVRRGRAHVRCRPPMALVHPGRSTGTDGTALPPRSPGSSEEPAHSARIERPCQPCRWREVGGALSATRRLVRGRRSAVRRTWRGSPAGEPVEAAQLSDLSARSLSRERVDVEERAHGRTWRVKGAALPWLQRSAAYPGRPLDASGREGPAEPTPEMSPPAPAGAWKPPRATATGGRAAGHGGKRGRPHPPSGGAARTRAPARAGDGRQQCRSHPRRGNGARTGYRRRVAGGDGARLRRVTRPEPGAPELAGDGRQQCRQAPLAG